MTDTLHFRTKTAAIVFKNEIRGQISDGAWENSRPHNHWEFWCKADVVVDGELGYEGHPLRTNYNVRSLLRYKEVKERVINLIRFAKSRFCNGVLDRFAYYLTSSFYMVEDKGRWDIFKEMSAEEMNKSSLSYIEKYKDDIIKDAMKNLSTVSFVRCYNIDPEVLFKLMVDSTLKSNEDHAKEVNDQRRADKELLAGYGITQDNLESVYNEIMAIPVDKKEIERCFDEIHCMIGTPYKFFNK